jgi:hypothetical protein
MANRQVIIDAVKKHAEGNIAKAKANVDVFLDNAVGVATHGDVLEEITKQLKVISDNSEIITVLDTHFKSND